MAGLAFGMIFGGMLLAGVIYFFALRNNVRAGIPVMKGFDNPLTGLTNLVKKFMYLMMKILDYKHFENFRNIVC